MDDLIDLDRYPLHRPADAAALVSRCRQELDDTGMFNLEGFVLPGPIGRAADEISPLLAMDSYTHARQHNVYFVDRVDGVADDHPALAKVRSVNHTLCGDQLSGTLVERIYEWRPLIDFIAKVIDKPRLHVMEDPLARINILEYREREALNWHFDRSQFTTTLLIRAALEGGEFEYRSDLRSATEPNYEGVAKTLRGEDPMVHVNPLAAGTLNVFAGKNTLHRVSPVRGPVSRVVAVFSYYDRPGVLFSDAERLGFYGRSAPRPVPSGP
jgi:hypothetical protein